MKNLFLLGLIIGLPMTAHCEKPLIVNEQGAQVETAQGISIPVELPTDMEGAELIVQAWIEDTKLLGHASIMKVSWDGEPLTTCQNREKTFTMKDGRALPSVTRDAWTLPYGPSPSEIEGATDSTYFIPSLEGEMTKLRFQLPNASPGSHVLEITHANEDISRPLLIGPVEIIKKTP